MNLNVVRQNFEFLSLKLDLQELLPKLLDKKLITLYDYESLTSKLSIQRNQEFLLNLDMYGEECEKEFYKYIEKQQFNLTIKHDDIKWISDSSHSERYTRIHILLRNRINATAVAVKLYERDFLCSEKLEKVLAAKTRLQKASELVDGFYRASRRPGFLACLLDILNDVQPSLFRQALEKLK